MARNETDYPGVIQHHGVKGMKWGQRRFQNKDGSLTPEGEKRYNSGNSDSKTDKSKNEAKNSNGKTKTEEALKKAKKAEDMTDEELAKAVKRITSTKKYNELTKEKTDEEVAEEERTKTLSKEVQKLNTQSKILDNTSTLATRSSSINRTINSIKNKKQIQEEMASMTNKELQERITRLNLEQQYSNLNAGRMSKGHAYVDNALNVIGTTAATAATALSVAALFKELKK